MSMPPSQSSSALLQRMRGPFRAIAVTVVPEAGQLSDEEWLDVEGIIGMALSLRPARMRRQLLLFVRLIELLPIARFGRPFTSLDPARRVRVLHALQRSPLPLVRRGLWGLRTLIFMGYYSRPQAALDIGYKADARGWEARR